MWKLHSRKDKERLLRSIEIDNPLQLAHLCENHVWWQRIATPKSLASSVREFAMDGHEKIATACADNPPKHGGRPRSDGAIATAVLA